MPHDNFIHIPFTKDNLDLYIVRTSILRAINEFLPQLKGKLLDMGCGKMPYKNYILENSLVQEYVGVDIKSENDYHTVSRPDHYWDGLRLPFDDESFNCVFCTEVLEHVPDTLAFLTEAYRVIKKNGNFFFTTPFLWPLHDVPYDEFRLSPFSLYRYLEKAGFKDITIKPTGGWHASMAQMLGLWVRRAPMSNKYKSVLSLLLKPIIHYLINKKEMTNNLGGLMMTGIYGTARK